MDFRQPVDEVQEDVIAVINGMGFSVVDFSYHGISTGMYVTCILYKPGGISAEDCAEVHRVLSPRLEVVLEERDITLEVSSPGIDRALKHADEFRIFSGKPVKILRDNSSEWESGIIEEAGEEFVVIKGEDGRDEIPYREIRKAKLH